MPWSQRIIIPPIRKVPVPFAAAFAKINAAFRILQAIANMEGKGDIKITKSDSNWIIENTASAGGGTVPDGYEETLITICDSGTPTDVYMLVKPSA